MPESTNRGWRRWLGPCVMASGVLLGAAFWAMYAAQLYADKRFDAMRAVDRTPPLLNGLQIRLDRYVDVTKLAHRERRVYLAFVTSDECPYCREDVQAWEGLLHSITTFVNVHALFITTSGVELPTHLSHITEQLGVSHTILKIPDQLLPVFHAETGLQVTPEVLLLDDALRVLWSTTRIKDASQRVLLNVLSESQLTQ